MIKMVNGKKRIFYLDALRAIAICLVILTHVSRLFCDELIVGTSSWTVAAFGNVFGIMGVPIFLLISGSLLLNREYELESFIKHRFSRILIPFIFWALIFPVFRMFVGTADSGVKSYISLFLSQYWFVWMLIGVYLFLPIINAFINKYGMKGVEYFLIIWVFVMILETFNLYPFHRLELSYFAGYLGYLVLGYWLANKNFKLSDKKMIYVGLATFVIFTGFNLFYTWHHGQVHHELDWFKYLTIICVLQSASVFLTFKYFATYCSKHKNTIKNKIYSFFKDTILSKLIISVSVCSYGMYLTHYFPLHIFRYIQNNIAPIFSYNPLIWMPIITGIIILTVWILTYVLSKIPYLKNISGAH